jgi:GNAT superfamily N-acetyltransferase
MRPTIEPISDLPLDQLRPLVAESLVQGFQLLRRLVDDWDAGTNRFALPGETLLVARGAGRIIGVCGLNVDPYADDPRIGRVRHLYVAADSRRAGIGRDLVGAIIAAARWSFDLVRLRTYDAGAARFYERLGFERCADRAESSHTLDLQPVVRSRDRSGARA